MVSVEGENPTSVLSRQPRLPVARGEPGKREQFSFTFLPLHLKCVLSAPIAWAPATPKTHSSVDQFTCPPCGDQVTDVPTGDAGKSH